MTKNAQYQKAYRKRQEALGNRQVTGFVPEVHAPAMRMLMRYLAENPTTRFDDVQLRDEVGKFVRVQL